MFKNKSAPIDSKKVNTIIGPGAKIEGKFQAAGIVRVEGSIYGEVVSDGDVIVGESGVVQDNIKARNVTIAGKVIGNIITPGRTHLRTTGVFRGDVDTKTLVIEEGACFEGNCRMSES